MFRFKGTIIRPNMKTQRCYIQRVHTLWDPILFTDCIDIKVHVHIHFKYISQQFIHEL